MQPDISLSPSSILPDICFGFIKDIAVPKCRRSPTSSAQLNQFIFDSRSVSKCLKAAFCSALLLADKACVKAYSM